jgi:lipoyl(octanoyl) transferase
MHGFSVNLSPDLTHFPASCPADRRKRRHQPRRLGIKVSAVQWDEALLARADEFLAMLDQPCPPRGNAPDLA